MRAIYTYTAEYQHRRGEYPRWRDGFATALDPRYYTIAYLDELIRVGAAQMFANDRAAVLAEIKIYPTGARDVHFLVGAGELDALIDLAPEVEAWGREFGCIGAIIESREGWAKAMKKHGYEPHQVAVRKDL